jgi:hypothetical protein
MEPIKVSPDIFHSVDTNDHRSVIANDYHSQVDSDVVQSSNNIPFSVNNPADDNIRKSNRIIVKPIRLTTNEFGTWNAANFSILEDYICSNIMNESYTPTTFKDAMACKDHKLWKASMDKEYQQVKDLGTFELVNKPQGANILPMKWVFKLKEQDGEPVVYKSRLVPLGCHQIEGKDYVDTYAPVSKYTSFRVLMSIAAVENLEVHQMDVHNAFPNAE